MSNHEWRLNKHKIEIGRGQQWRKKDSGNIGTIRAISSDHVVMQQPRKKRAHHVSKKDLFLFWDRI